MPEKLCAGSITPNLLPIAAPSLCPLHKSPESRWRTRSSLSQYGDQGLPRPRRSLVRQDQARRLHGVRGSGQRLRKTALITGRASLHRLRSILLAYVAVVGSSILYRPRQATEVKLVSDGHRWTECLLSTSAAARWYRSASSNNSFRISSDAMRHAVCLTTSASVRYWTAVGSILSSTMLYCPRINKPPLGATIP